MTREKKVTPMKLALGSIRRRGKNGCFAYRCQVNGRRTEISLQTKDYHEALKKVADLVPIAQARTAEVVAAHVNEARGFAKQATDLALVDAWPKYEQHPDRAMPHTVSEQLAYRLSHRRIYVKQFKTGKEVSIPLAAQLYDTLIEAQKWKCNQYVCPKIAARYNKTDGNGKNVGNNLIDHDVIRVIRWIGLEPSVSVPGRKKKMTVYGFHSLRHSFASFCAEAGVPKAVLLSILGTESEIADKYYTHVGNEAQEKAIAAISGTTFESPDKAKIQKALDFIGQVTIPTMESMTQLKEILLGA